jgi:hypothetical protein
MLGHSYQNFKNRTIFRLRDFDTRLHNDNDVRVNIIEKYKKLSEDEKLSTAEFINFIFVYREEIASGKQLHFYLRNHVNRPQTTELVVPKDISKRYDELNKNELFHLSEFINFLLVIKKN